MSRPLPPPPHDPLERILRTTLGDWQVRDFPADDPKQRYFASHGLCHLQLWQPRAGVSILTPSPLTIGCYEAFPIAGWKHRDASWTRFAATVRHQTGVVPPGLTALRALERWFLHRADGDDAADEPLRPAG